MSVNKETNKVLKKYKGPSGQETLFRSHKNWIRDTQIIPIINQIEGSIKSLKEDWSNMKDTTGFNMDYPYMKLLELLITQKEEIEDFYTNIKMVENREGKKTYKIKDEVSM